LEINRIDIKEAIMKQLRSGLGVLGAVLIATTDVWAAAGIRQDNSGMFVWVFLGVCALIVVAQAVPALFLLASAVKGFAAVIKGRKKVTVQSDS